MFKAKPNEKKYDIEYWSNHFLEKVELYTIEESILSRKVPIFIPDIVFVLSSLKKITTFLMCKMLCIFQFFGVTGVDQ